MGPAVEAAETSIAAIVPHVATIGGAVLLVLAAVAAFRYIRRSF